MPRELLIELGCEEIPAAPLRRALIDLATLAAARLGAARLDFESIRTLGAPRRLAVLVAGLADRQADVSERVVGPPVKAAFDASGKPTRAAIGFAEKNGVALDSLERAEVEGQAGKKGEYVVATRRETGRAAIEVLPGLIGELFAALPWPKSMRWPDSDVAFVRPVHWLVALHGGEVVPLSFAGVAAGRMTRGHRFLAPGEVALDGSAAQYERALREAHVIVDPDKRKTMVLAELARIEGETGARVRPDAALVDEVVNLVEYPVAVAGSFDRSFLEVPEEVVVSAMRAHQRYFAMDEGGRLAPRFVTIAGTVVKDLAQVRSGNERVLAARLADAQFFFREDRKHPLRHFQDRLEGIVFQKKLGTVAQKVARIEALVGSIATRLAIPSAHALRAAALCKFDLTTAMVGEFPELQGEIGRRYAAPHEKPAVATAIFEHYLPRGAKDGLPTSPEGALVGLADRLDTLVGGFAAGLQPTGSADAFGLRRAGLGLLRILLHREWRLPLDELIGFACAALDRHGIAVEPAVRAAVRGFLVLRLGGYLSEALELPADCVDAALAADDGEVVDVLARAGSLARMRARPDFLPLAAAFKRLANILKGEGPARAPDPGAFVVDEERALWAAFGKIEARVTAGLADRDYAAVLTTLAELKAPVDTFFDKVLVMDPDDRVRQNRLALLGTIHAGFHRIADFRQLAV